MKRPSIDSRGQRFNRMAVNRIQKASAAPVAQEAAKAKRARKAEKRARDAAAQRQVGA